MNKLTKEITRTMKPSAALIAYTCEDLYGQNKYFLELRHIDNDGLMGAGKPVSKNFVKSLVDNFSDHASTVPHGEIPERLLYADSRKQKYVWHTPPCSKYMYFKSILKIPNGEYCIPGLVWNVNDNSLSMYAYGAKRLTPNTRLFSAPFFNVNPNDGSVCLGNASLKMPETLTFHNFLKFWEDKFFLSEFSHVTSRNPVKNNLVLVVKKSVHSFDNTELLPVKKLKLKELLK